MPLNKFESEENRTFWGLWHITENEDELWHQLTQATESQYEYQSIHHPQKRLEWLASRLIIQRLVELTGARFQGIYKDAFGKPHLIKVPYYISIAHCFPMAAGAIHKSQPVGIDIDKPRDKLLVIKERFLNEPELRRAGNNLEILCKYWTAKEALYKIYGRKKLIFRKHLLIKNSKHAEMLCGSIRYQGFNQDYELRCIKHQGHLITYNF